MSGPARDLFRDVRIIERLLAPDHPTLADVADEVGLSAERIRQIARRYGITGRVLLAHRIAAKPPRRLHRAVTQVLTEPCRVASVRRPRARAGKDRRYAADRARLGPPQQHNFPGQSGVQQEASDATTSGRMPVL